MGERKRGGEEEKKEKKRSTWEGHKQEKKNE